MKIATQIFGVLGFLGAVSGQGGATSQTTEAGLSALWSIADPDPTIDSAGRKVDLSYDIAAQLTKPNLSYKVYTDVLCNEDMKVLTGDFESPIADDVGLKFTGDASTNTPSIKVDLLPTGLGSGNSIYYTEDTVNGQTRAKIQFCIRFSLILPDDDDPSAVPVEVNFQESIIIIFVDLTDGFDVTGINVAPKERLIRTSTQAYEVVADFCDTLTGVINQGSVVCIEVTPEAEALTAGLVMREINSFTFTTDDGGADLSQIAIENGIAKDLLTAHESCLNKEKCTWSTILKAGFYVPITDGDASRAVTGSGVATMKFGEEVRRLGEDGRELQEEDGAGASEFDLNFDINPAAPVDESSAATVAYGLVAALLGLSMVV